MNRKLLIPTIAAVLYGSNAIAATTYTGDDYLAIHVEAEAYDSKDDRWYYFDSTTSPDVPPDHDPNHSSTASGNAYMEVLPDRRLYGDARDEVLDDDGNIIPIGGLWMTAGTGPRLNYMIDFPEAGRYIVHVRALKNNTEDNSVHAGINDVWPNVGPLQLSCEGNVNNKWQWRSAQRTLDNHCGDDSIPVYVDVPSAGQHMLMFSAREDGYEQDSFFLIKNRGDNTRICSPANMADITCKDGSYDVLDGFVDVALSISAADTNIMVGNTVEVTHVLSNEDALDTATSSAFSVDIPAGVEFVSADSSDCSVTANVLTCAPGDLYPQHDKEYVVTYTFPTVGAINYLATTSSTEPDDNPGNDGSSIGFQVFAEGPRVDAQLELAADKQIVGTNDTVSLAAIVTNVGFDAADAATLNMTLPQGASLVSSSMACGIAPSLSCDLGTLSVNESKTVKLELSFAIAGSTDLNATVSASNDYNPANNAAGVELYTSSGELFEETDGLLVAEAEAFAAHQIGTMQAENGWYLVSATMQPPAALYAVSNLKDTASANGYVVALERGETAAPFEGGEAAVLSYRVFFNSVGTYYLQARAFVESGGGNSVNYALDGNWDHAMGSLSWCDSAEGWSWSKITESAGTCQNTSVASFEVTTPGEHVLSLSMQDAAVALDKLVISSDASLIVEGLGADSTLYADKVIDLGLASSVTEINIKAGVQSTIDFIISNNNATATASDVTLTVTGLEAIALPETNDLDCQLLEDGEAAYKLACNIGVVGPGQSQQVALPLLAAAQGDSSAVVTVSAMQSDDRDDNNTHTVTVIASAGEGQASGGGGAMATSLALIGLLLLPLRAIVRRRVA